MDWKRTAVVPLTALGITGPVAFAQQTRPPAQPSPMMGPGMMGGHAPGHGPGSGPPDDDGVGLWVRPGHGGRRMHPGVMGMMGFGLGPIHRLDLNESQRRQVLKLQDDLRDRNWDAMGKMQDEMSKLRDAMWAEKRERPAIPACYRRLSELRLRMLENALDVRDKAEALLTPLQREHLRNVGP